MPSTSTKYPVPGTQHQVPSTLVTGGAGFIGSHLCEKLINEGHHVVCLDNFNDFYDPKIKKRNIAGLLNNPKFTLIPGDILNKELLNAIFSGDFEAVKQLSLAPEEHPIGSPNPKSQIPNPKLLEKQISIILFS